MEYENNRGLYFPRVFEDGDLNHFIISLITYDRVHCNDFTFVKDVLCRTPKKYHELLIDLPMIELSGTFSKEPMESYYDEMKPHFIHVFGYNEVEFEKLADRLKSKIQKFVRVADGDLMKYLISDVSDRHFLDLHDAIRVAKCGCFSAVGDKSILDGKEISLKMDEGQSARIFEVNRLLDLSKAYQSSDFNLYKFIDLRNKKGAKILRELIFKEERFDNPTELMQEYNDMILGQGVHKNNLKKLFWGISNAVSVAGAFSPIPILSLVVTFTSMTLGEYKHVFRKDADIFRKFITKDLSQFTENRMKKF